MEIQKIFSDMYDEERLYSVLLTEDEMALYQYMFSDGDEVEEVVEEKPKKKMSKAAKAGLIAAGTTATAAGAIYGGRKLGVRLTDKAMKKGMEAAKEHAHKTGGYFTPYMENATKKEIEGKASYKIGKMIRKPGDYIAKLSTKEGRAAMKAAKEEAKKKKNK